MSRKFFDIYPPQKIKKERTKEISGTSEKIQHIPAKRGKRVPLSLKSKVILFSLIFFLIAGFGFLHFYAAKAEIEIWPKIQVLSSKEKIVASIKVSQEDTDFWLENKVVSAKLVEEEKTALQQFPATEKVLKEIKAKGQIRVYNAYSTASQVLVANTRFISSEGKLFKSIERVTIPGTEYEKGKLQPGYIDIEIQAAEAGESYNIEPSTFSIPGLAGTPKYTAFYGKSFTPMTGGFKGEVLQVSKEDIDKAKESLTAQLLENAKNSLRNEVGDDFILLEESLKGEVIEASSLVSAGSQVDSFSFQVKVKTRAMALKKEHLHRLARGFLLIQALPSQEIHEESLQIDYVVESTNIDKGEAVLKVDSTVKVYKNTDNQAFRLELCAKSFDETQRFLENQPEISNFEVKFWPFWINRVPKDVERIKIKLNFQ